MLRFQSPHRPLPFKRRGTGVKLHLFIPLSFSGCSSFAPGVSLLNEAFSPRSFPLTSSTGAGRGRPCGLVPFTLIVPWTDCSVASQQAPPKVWFISFSTTPASRPLPGLDTSLAHCYKLMQPVEWALTYPPYSMEPRWGMLQYGWHLHTQIMPMGFDQFRWQLFWANIAVGADLLIRGGLR